jgi:hypothetical protein
VKPLFDLFRPNLLCEVPSMLRASCLAVALAVGPLGSLRAEAPADPGANAALRYWQAFATLPRFTEDEQKALNAGCLTMPLDARAREIAARAAYALQMLHRGAAQPRCAWGIAWDEMGVEVRLPHAEAARVLASLACLRARLRFEEGQNAGALDDVVAAMTLGRHVSQDGVFVLLLTGQAIEHLAIETLARSLPRLDARAIRDLRPRLEALPRGGTPAEALRQEERWALDWFVRKVKDARDRDSLLAVLSRCYDSEAKGRAFLEECGGTAAGVLGCAEQTRGCFERMAAKLDQPPDAVEKAFEPEEKKLAGNPVFKVLFPSLVKVRWAQARVEVRRALLSAALAVRLDGRDALKRHPDPVAGGPFEYAAFEGGFELRSRLKGKDDKPVVLTVGRRDK